MVCKMIKQAPDEEPNNDLDNLSCNYLSIGDNYLFLINVPLYRLHNKNDYLHMIMLKDLWLVAIDPLTSDMALYSVIQQGLVCPEDIQRVENLPIPRWIWR